jgi:hypothetical protein
MAELPNYDTKAGYRKDFIEPIKEQIRQIINSGKWGNLKNTVSQI